MLWYILETLVGTSLLLYWLGLDDFKWDNLNDEKREVLFDEILSQ